MAKKASHAFRTISEASDELGLKPHVLRFWEVKFPELKPVTRAGGRRFYRPEDVDFLRGLRILLHEEKMKIKDVQKIIKKKGAAEVVKLGASSVNRLPPKPVSERNLVPDRITPTVPVPEDTTENVATAPQPVQSADVVPFSAARAKPEPEVIQPVVVQPPAPEPAPAPKPAASAAETEELENALDRLSALRSRWKKFAE